MTKALVTFALVLLAAPLWARPPRQTTRTAHKLVAVAPKDNASVPDTVSIVPGSDPRVRLSGYEKPLRARREVMLVSCLAAPDSVLSDVELRLEYVDEQGRQLHVRQVWLSGANVPGGETRSVAFDSWDLQNTRFYMHGPRPRPGRWLPYDVRASVVRQVWERRPSEAASAASDEL